MQLHPNLGSFRRGIGNILSGSTEAADDHGLFFSICASKSPPTSEVFASAAPPISVGAILFLVHRLVPNESHIHIKSFSINGV